MKKYLKTIAIMMALCLVLCSCGETEPDPKPAQTPGQPSSAQTQTPPAGSEAEAGKKDPEPEKTEPEVPSVQYLYNEEPKPLAAPQGRIRSFLAEFTGEVDGVSGLYDYELSFVENIWDDTGDMHYLYATLNTDKTGGDRYLNGDADEERLNWLTDSVIGTFGPYNEMKKVEQDSVPEQGYLTFTAEFDSGETISFEADAASFPEGLEEGWNDLAVTLNGWMGYATTGFTAFVPNLDVDAFQRMSARANWAGGNIDSEYNLYMWAFDGDKRLLVKNPNYLYDYEVVASGEYFPVNVQYDGTADDLYWMITNEALGSYDLYSSGRGLIMEDVSNFQAENGKLYFQHGDFKGIYEYMWDSSFAEELICDAYCSGASVIGEWILYSDGEDGSCKVYNMNTKETLCLVDRQAGCPIIDGNRLYYVDGEKSVLSMLDLVTGETTEYPELKTSYTYYLTPDYLYFMDMSNDNILTSVYRSYMSNKCDPQAPYETAYCFRKGEQILFARDMQVVTDRFDSSGAIEEFTMRYNYFDADMTWWLDVVNDPDRAM